MMSSLGTQRKDQDSSGCNIQAVNRKKFLTYLAAQFLEDDFIGWTEFSLLGGFRSMNKKARWLVDDNKIL